MEEGNCEPSALISGTTYAFLGLKLLTFFFFFLQALLLLQVDTHYKISIEQSPYLFLLPL